MKYFLDLFAGIGGFALGAEWAGIKFDAHYFSEVDPYAISVYQHRFPDAIGLGDIKSIGGGQLPTGDWIIAGGFPCQDISVAGKGAGLEGERSGLWFEYARIIGELRPKYAIMENVGALTIRGLDRVLGSLSEIGYDAEWQDIRASDVGAPHRRERIWIVGYPNGQRLEKLTDGLTEGTRDTDGECGRENVSDSKGERWRAWRTGRPLGDCPRETKQSFGILADAEKQYRSEYGQQASITGRGSSTLANSTCRGLEGRTISAGSRREREGTPDVDGCGEKLENPLCSRRNTKGNTVSGEKTRRRPSARPWRSGWWSTEPDVGRVAHGVPARVDRLKCLGNSIVPEIAELIFCEVKKYF